MSDFSIPVLCCLSVHLTKIIYSKLLMNYNAYTSQGNTNVQYHSIPQSKEVTDMSLYALRVIAGNIWGADFLMPYKLPIYF